MTKLEAETRYRMAFSQWSKLGGWDSDQTPERKDLESIMDECQPLIARMPGAEWRAFTDTVPGFKFVWSPKSVSRMLASASAHIRAEPATTARQNGCTPEWNEHYKEWCCGCDDELHCGDQQCSIISTESAKRKR